MTDKQQSAPKSSATLTNSLLSSPPRAPSSHGKERRNPSITPRKFQKFFTPRSRVSSKPSAARRALRDLGDPALNRCQTPSSPLKPVSEEIDEDDLPSYRGAKRRKFRHTPDHAPQSLPSPLNTSPAILSTPDTRPRLQSPIQSLRLRRSVREILDETDESEAEEDEDDLPRQPREYKRPVQLARRGLGGQLLQRMTGGMSRTVDRDLPHPIADWRNETANFYSKPEHSHFCTSHDGAPQTIPFCVTSCHKNSLVAVGDEEGHIRFLDTNKEFSKIHVSFPAHGNAVIDLDFSTDDYLLATASGDQTGKVIDVMTQKPISTLTHHTASLKQVRFQPGRGENCVLATSGRDGSVHIWDLRCRGGPVQEINVGQGTGVHCHVPKTIIPGAVVNSIYDAHARPVKPAKNQMPGPASGLGDVARLGEVPGRIGEVSVTAVQFLPAGREHLLLSACEADSSIKLWDIRAMHTSRSHHKTSTPLSFTATPASHAAFRPFGISSMALGGGDASRLYALCKDNTVYAYSTAHLILGHAPELLPTPAGQDPPRYRRHAAAAQGGLGPLYGFRHPMLKATSFYVKAAIRPAADGREELLAVGSSDNCAVLFPTDERYIQTALRNGGDPDETYFVGASTASLPERGRPAAAGRPGGLGLVRSSSMTGLFSRQADSTPVVRRGTPLVRGHEKEVGALAWTNEGKLVTVGDDWLVRCWSEGAEEARDLRLGGETEGRRWGCGWADVGDQWEGDVDDW